MIRLLLATLLALQLPFSAAAQPLAKSTKSAAPANDIFSGSVTATSAGSVTVVRKVPARPDETRVFILDQNTKIEGTLKVNARVTVRFKADSGGAIHALRIIVRADAKASTSAGRAEQTAPRK